MSEYDDIDLQAAEYVLGTLDAAERAAISSRRQHDQDLNHRIEAWQQRLAPLGDLVVEVNPEKDLLPQIEARIDQLKTPQNDELKLLKGQLARWKFVSFASSMAAMVLIVVLSLQPTVAPIPDGNFVAVFQKDDQQPAFLLSIDLKTRELNIRPVSADPQPGKTYQLWILAEQLGPVPKSLGLLQGIEKSTRKQLVQYDPEVLKYATYGISVEPEGGSPTGRPTGPAIHGKLYPTEI